MNICIILDDDRGYDHYLDGAVDVLHCSDPTYFVEYFKIYVI